MEWKYKVGDKVTNNGHIYTIENFISICGEQYYEARSESTGFLAKFTKYYFELRSNRLEPKQKSLFEQALDLLGIKVEQEFTCDLTKAIYKFSEDGTIWFRPTDWTQFVGSSYTLTHLLIKDRNVKPYKPKSEAELILDELAKVVNKAEDILRRSGR